MSRVVVFGPDNISRGEFQAKCSRGWMLDGSKSVSGGGQTTVSISADVAAQKWLQVGRMVLVEHAKLPAWAGMIDTPWRASLPAQLTLYNAAYLLSLRVPDASISMTGTVYGIASRVIDAINAQEELYLRAGNFSGLDVSREQTFDQQSYWQRLNEMVARAGKEMFLRPAMTDGRLTIYVDIQDRAGVDTGFLLHDGENANMQVSEATLDGQIVNRLIGVSDQSTQASRLATGALLNENSRAIYRLRSKVNLYSGISDPTTLLQNTTLDLAYAAWPRLILKLNILDVGDTFKYLQPGNSFIIQAANNLYLPGGVQGWRGVARLTALAYDEDSESVGATVEAQYGQ